MTGSQTNLVLNEGFGDAAGIEDEFRRAVLEGLGRTPKRIPCKYLSLIHI